MSKLTIFVMCLLLLGMGMSSSATAQQNHHKWGVGVRTDSGGIDYPPAVVTICLPSGECQTQSTNGGAQFFLPIEATVVYVHIEVADPDYYPVDIEWLLIAGKHKGPIYHWVELQEYGAPPIWWDGY
jgi:hypothetical protein